MKALLALCVLCSLIMGCYQSDGSQNTIGVEVAVSVDTQAPTFSVQFSAHFQHATPATLSWNFGDGYLAQGKTIQHSYASPGQYLASLEYSYQGQTYQKEIEVQIPGANRQVHIAAQQNFAIDSDHNDPNIAFSRNDDTAQIINNPVSLSGILIAKNTCQGGRLCQQGDLVDRYRVNLDYSDQITLEIITGKLDIRLTGQDGNVIHYPQQSTTLTLPAQLLGFGQFQLKLTLTASQPSARYLIHVNKAQTSENLHYQPGKLIVVWQDQTNPELVDISDKRLQGVTHNNLFQARELFAKKSNVRSVSLNYYRQALNVTDNLTTWQWPLVFQQIDQLWQPLASRGQTPGEGVTVAVLDTGIFSQHPNLQGLKLHSGHDFVSDPVNAGDGDGWDTNPEDPGDSQLSFHGTHITGIIAAQPPIPNAHQQWITGLAWGVEIMPLRVLGLNGGTSYDMIQALRYAAGLQNESGLLPIKPADIINLSLGGSQFSAAEQATLDAVIASGAIVVAAAGNQSHDQVNYPAGYQSVIAVGALNTDGTTASYSNQGPYLDLMAPGGECLDALCTQGIRSLGANATTFNTQHEYQASWHNLAGTSMASAHVSALLAILRSYLPAMDSQQLQSLVAKQAINTSITHGSFSEDSGWGTLDSEKIMRLMDTSPLDHGQLWTTQRDIYLDNNASRSLPLIYRGERPIDELQMDYDPEQLTVSLQEGVLNIQARGELEPPQTLTLSSSKNHKLVISIHGTNTQLPSQVLEHLYLTLSDDAFSGPVRRASQQGSDWQAYVPRIFPGQTIQASSDLDYDGVYCEPGEFCAIKKLDSSTQGEVKLWGDLLTH